MNDRSNYSGIGWTWSTLQDEAWRATINSSYFENKAPGVDLILPAAAVIGAATAFGLVTLLPLNVPAEKPLMYCNTSPLAQDLIRIENYFYSCKEGRFSIFCSDGLEDGSSGDDCSNSDTMLQCNSIPLTTGLAELSCLKGTLRSNSPIVCDSSAEFNNTVVVDGIFDNETVGVVECYFGELPENQASVVPKPVYIEVVFEAKDIFLNTWVAQALIMPNKVHEPTEHQTGATVFTSFSKHITTEPITPTEPHDSIESYTDYYQ